MIGARIVAVIALDDDVAPFLPYQQLPIEGIAITTKSPPLDTAVILQVVECQKLKRGLTTALASTAIALNGTTSNAHSVAALIGRTLRLRPSPNGRLRAICSHVAQARFRIVVSSCVDADCHVVCP
jgi:hypothetical protein